MLDDALAFGLEMILYVGTIYFSHEYTHDLALPLNLISCFQYHMNSEWPASLTRVRRLSIYSGTKVSYATHPIIINQQSRIVNSN